jgi:hypothetical protein
MSKDYDRALTFNYGNTSGYYIQGPGKSGVLYK